MDYDRNKHLLEALVGLFPDLTYLTPHGDYSIHHCDDREHAERVARLLAVATGEPVERREHKGVEWIETGRWGVFWDGGAR